MEIPILPYMVYQYTFKRFLSGWMVKIAQNNQGGRVHTAPAVLCDDYDDDDDGDDDGDGGFGCRK
ncbi:hypothetical protein HOY82DRAFT_586188 [Tuber indicum]|nr:hypothetical protein HOY82DRAFT_586188 [Tuber indicum]